MNALDLQFLWKTFFVALSGVPITLLITIVALAISLPLGFLFALIRLKRMAFFSQFIKVYVSFVRGTPIIIQIFIVYSSIPLVLNMIANHYQLSIDIYKVHPIWYAFIVFAFNTTAVLIEVFRSALFTIDKGQQEAAQAIGLTTFQTYRRILIPQLLVVSLPNICTTTINLIKATSLGYALSLHEITLRAKVAANVGYNYIEAYIDILLVYLLLTAVVEYSFKILERRMGKYKLAAV